MIGLTATAVAVAGAKLRFYSDLAKSARPGAPPGPGRFGR